LRSPPITVWTVLVAVVTVVDGLHRVQEIEVLNLAAGVSVLGLLEEVPAKSVVVAKSVVTRTLNPVFWLPTTTILRVAILAVALLDVPFAKFGLELSHVDIEAFDISSIDGELVGVKDTNTIPSEFKLAISLTVQVVHSEPDVARKTRLLRHKIPLVLDSQKDVIAFAQLGLAPIAALIIFAIAVVTIVVVTSVILVVIRIVAAPIIFVVRAAPIILVVRAAIIILVVRAAPIILVVRAAPIILVVRAAPIILVVRAAPIILVVRATFVFVVRAAPIILVVRAAIIILVVRATFVFVVLAVAIRVSVAAAAKLQIRLTTTFFRCIPDYRAIPVPRLIAIPGVDLRAVIAVIAVKVGIEPIWFALIAIPIVGFTAPVTFLRVWHSDNLQLWCLWFWFFVVPLSWCR
jgi:hypothetical protein